MAALFFLSAAVVSIMMVEAIRAMVAEVVGAAVSVVTVTGASVVDFCVLTWVELTLFVLASLPKYLPIVNESRDQRVGPK